MDIDLRDRGISRLCFSAEETSEEEATVASAVAVLLADHNQIQRVQGLNAVFVNLVELRLAHNQLGRSSTPYYRVNRHNALDGGDHPWHCSCAGVASWIEALPATLEVLDVAHNHLHSFLECTCAAGNEVAAPRKSDVSPSGVSQAERLLNEERHRCPFAIALFFPAVRFPRLRELHLSHNAFALSLRESDEMQAHFDASCPALAKNSDAATLSASATLTLVDLSFNKGVAAVNAFLLSAPLSTDTDSAAPCTMNVCNTSIEDLQGISAMSLYQPTTRWSLQLHPTPLSRSVLAAPPPVLHELLQAVVTTLEDGGGAVGAPAQSTVSASTDGLSGVLASKRAAPASFLERLEEVMRETAQNSDVAVPAAVAELGGQRVALMVYACLLRQVVPSLDTVEATLSVASSEQLLVASLQRLLRADSIAQLPQPQARRLPMDAAPPLHPPLVPPPPPRGLGSAANAAAPELRSRVVVGPDDAHADPAGAMAASDGSSGPVASAVDTNRSGDSGARRGRFQAALAALRPSRSASATPATTRSVASASSAASSVGEAVAAEATAANNNGEDFFTPTRLSAEDRLLYEALCREAQELQAAVLTSNERSRDFRSQCDALRHQLTQDRSLVADQGKEVSRLREEKAQLEQSLERQRRRLEKRQKEVVYGVTAIQSREAAARERAAMERLAAREKAVARRERQLRQQAARAGALAVEFHSDGPAGQRKKLRSEVLREAAVRKRLAEQENRDPLAYAPAPFKSDVRRTTPRTSPDARAEALAGAAAVSEEEQAYFNLYGSLAMAPALQEVADHYVAQLPAPQQQQLREASTRLPSSGSRGSSAVRRASSPSGGSPLSGKEAAVVSNLAGLSASPDTGRDLSSLSLSELLDAAAAIRQKQLALQQLHQQWRQPPPPPPSHLNDAAYAIPEKEQDEGEDHFSQVVLEDLGQAEPVSAAAQEEHRVAHANSPFRSVVSDAPPRPPPPPPRSAQQLFDMVLAQRKSPQPYGSSSAKDDGDAAAAPPTRSPFFARLGEVLQVEEDSSGNGVTADDADDTSRSVSAGRPPQTNRALFH